MRLVLCGLLFVLSACATVSKETREPSGGTDVRDELVGKYGVWLKESHPSCPSLIHVRKGDTWNDPHNVDIGIYGAPEGSGNVIAQALYLNAGEMKVESRNPQSSRLLGMTVMNSTMGDGKIKFVSNYNGLDGSKTAKFFDGSYDMTVLRFRNRVSVSHPKLDIDQSCVYLREN